MHKRQCIIIDKLNGLKNEKRIESEIRVFTGDFTEIVEIKNLTSKHLKNTSRIFFLLLLKELNFFKTFFRLAMRQ